MTVPNELKLVDWVIYMEMPLKMEVRLLCHLGMIVSFLEVILNLMKLLNWPNGGKGEPLYAMLCMRQDIQIKLLLIGLTSIGM